LLGMSKMGEDPEESKAREEQRKSEKQVETVEKALEAERKRSEEYLTQLKYARADVENLMKRFDRQLEDAKLYANERIVIELLDAVDELELAVKSAASCDSAETLVQGVEMTLKKLTKILESEEVCPIESVGEPFDPEKHNAVARIEKKGVEGCTIIEEVRKGYTMRGKVIRASIVKVVVPSSQSQKEIEGDDLK
jgi:molecular chaperone GrpE